MLSNKELQHCIMCFHSASVDRVDLQCYMYAQLTKSIAQFPAIPPPEV